MAVKMAAGAGGPIRWAIELQGPALDMLTDKNRNELVGYSFKGAGFDWGKTFLPKRFSHYVDRNPFPYPRHRLGFYYNKARRMEIVAGIIQRLSLTKGWDPWKPDKPSLALIIEWKKMNPNRYNNTSAKAMDAGGGLIGDMRRNAKRAVMEIIDEMCGDGKFLPLVESGAARAKAIGGFTVRPTVSANKAMIKIPIPFGHPTNTTVGNVVRTLPTWEVKWVAKRLRLHLIARLSNKGLSVGPTGVLTTRAPTVDQRAPAIVAER